MLIQGRVVMVDDSGGLADERNELFRVPLDIVAVLVVFHCNSMTGSDIGLEASLGEELLGEMGDDGDVQAQKLRVGISRCTNNVESLLNKPVVVLDTDSWCRVDNTFEHWLDANSLEGTSDNSHDGVVSNGECTFQLAVVEVVATACLGMIARSRMDTAAEDR